MINAVRLLDRCPGARLPERWRIGMAARPDDDQGAVERTDAGQLLQLNLSLVGSHCPQPIRT